MNQRNPISQELARSLSVFLADLFPNLDRRRRYNAKLTYSPETTLLAANDNG